MLAFGVKYNMTVIWWLLDRVVESWGTMVHTSFDPTVASEQLNLKFVTPEVVTWA